MSNYRVQQGVRELYITDGKLKQAVRPGPSPINPTPSAPQSYNQVTVARQQVQYTSAGTPNYKSAVYANTGDLRVDIVEPRSGNYGPTSYSPASSRSAGSPTYVNMSHAQYSSPPGSEPRYSPPPPPYSAVAQEREYQNLRELATERRYPSPAPPGGYQGYGVRGPGEGSPARSYQDRTDPETVVPTYTTTGQYPSVSKYPEGAPSRIVYTTQGPPAGKQYVQSRPAHPGGPPPPRQQVPRQTATSPGPPAQRPRPAGSPLQHQPVLHYNSPPGQPRQGVPYQYSPPGDGRIPTSPTRSYQVKPALEGYKNERAPPGKEDEVDALTSLLMQNMDASAETDYFGYCEYCGHAVRDISSACSAFTKTYHLNCFRCFRCGMCANCGNPIIGQDSGCKAFGQPFHIKCFVCVSCDICLKGQPFFAMDGRPYCEGCYMNTLEKCTVCSKPITKRILKATGKPYHPHCFTCVVCGKSLDGVPFTVDATNQIHCIEDFHRKFAPRCCVCSEPIMPERGQEEAVRIVAMDKSFHTACYKCEDCGLLLSSEADGRGCYPLDDHILCKSCNAQRIQALTTKMTTEL